MTDLAERLRDLQFRNESTHNDAEAKEMFLLHLQHGVTTQRAAVEAGRTSSWFRNRMREDSSNFDRVFRDRFQQIMAPDGEHKQSIVEIAREALIDAAKTGNVRAIEKVLMAYDPDFAFLRPAQYTGDVNIECLQVLMPQLPTELLTQMREALVQAKQAELPVIEQ